MANIDIFMSKTQDALEEILKDGLTVEEMLSMISQTIGLSWALFCAIPETIENKKVLADGIVAHLKKSFEDSLSQEQQSNEF